MKHPSTGRRSTGFTLIELLVVISIIGVLAALTLTVMRGANIHAKIGVARSEMIMIEKSLEDYKSQYGTYPPSADAATNAPLWNGLYYELSGVTNVTVSGEACYQTLFGGSVIGARFYANMFGVPGVVNCSKPADPETPQARSFVHLRDSQIGTLPVTNQYGGFAVNFLITSVGGPDDTYKPMGYDGLNPFRYVAPGPANHNANGYDLWVQLVIGGKTNLLCNWNDSISINNSLP